MELVLPGLTAYVREVYQNSRPSRMGRWLMIRVSGPEILEDVKTLRGSGCRSGEREAKAENIRLAGKGRERCAGGKEEKEGQSSVFSSIQMKYAMSYLAIVSVVLILLNTYPCWLPGPAVWLQAGFAEEPGCGDGSALMELELLTSDQVERVMTMLDSSGP